MEDGIRVKNYCRTCCQHFTGSRLPPGISTEKELKISLFYNAKVSPHLSEAPEGSHSKMYDFGPCQGSPVLLDKSVFLEWMFLCLQCPGEKDMRQFLQDNPSVTCTVRIYAASILTKAQLPDYSQMFDYGPHGPQAAKRKTTRRISTGSGGVTVEQKAAAGSKSLSNGTGDDTLRPGSSFLEIKNVASEVTASTSETLGSIVSSKYPTDPLAGVIMDNGPKSGEPQLDVPVEFPNDNPPAEQEDEKKAGIPNSKKGKDSNGPESTGQGRKHYPGLQYGAPEFDPITKSS
jgi:hypothetical protein